MDGQISKTLVNANSSIVMEGGLEVAWRQGWKQSWIRKELWESLGVTEIFIILTVVMILWVYSYINTQQIVHFK